MACIVIRAPYHAFLLEITLYSSRPSYRDSCNILPWFIRRELITTLAYGERIKAEALTVDFAIVNAFGDDSGRLSIDLASNAECCSQNFLDSSTQILGERLVAHGPCNLDNLIKADGFAVLDILLLLAIARWLFQRSDDKG